MNTESNNGWKVLLSLAVIALLASAVLFLWPRVPKEQPEITTGKPTESVAPVVAVSTVSSIDDVESALLKNALDEATLLDESSDVQKLSSDSAALESVSKSYDENTL